MLCKFLVTTCRGMNSNPFPPWFASSVVSAQIDYLNPESSRNPTDTCQFRSVPLCSLNFIPAIWFRCYISTIALFCKQQGSSPTRQSQSPPKPRTVAPTAALIARWSPLLAHATFLPLQQACYARTHPSTTTWIASYHHASPLPPAEPQPPCERAWLGFGHPLLVAGDSPAKQSFRCLEAGQCNSHFVAWRLPSVRVQHWNPAEIRCEEKKGHQIIFWPNMCYSALHVAHQSCHHQY